MAIRRRLRERWGMQRVRPAGPDAHDVTLTMWNGGTAVYFEIGRPEWYKLTCPECVDRLGLDPD